MGAFIKSNKTKKLVERLCQGNMDNKLHHRVISTDPLLSLCSYLTNHDQKQGQTSLKPDKFGAEQIWSPKSLKPDKFGAWQVLSQTNLEPDKFWFREIWSQTNLEPGKFGARIIWTQTNLEPDKFGAQQVWSPESWEPNKFGARQVWSQTSLARVPGGIYRGHFLNLRLQSKYRLVLPLEPHHHYLTIFIYCNVDTIR